MSVFNKSFFELFINKHGKEIYENIKNNIIKEAEKNVSNGYISMIFNIAYAKYIGIHESRIEDFIKDILGQEEIAESDIKGILTKHEHTIKTITEYIASTEKEFK